MTHLSRLAIVSLALLTMLQSIPAAETLVAVGYGGRRMISHDGQTWTVTSEWAENGKDDSNNLMGVVYGQGKFVAVGGGGWSRDSQAGHILVSKDGQAWTEVLKLPNRVNPVIYGDGKFVTAGPPDKSLYVSTDGEKWNAGDKVPFKGYALWFRHGAYGNGTFVMMGECTPKKEQYWCLTTKDGKKLTHFRTDLPHLRSLTFGNGKFVAVGQGGVIATSTDGDNWHKQITAPEDKLDWVHWTGKGFLCGGGKLVYASADGQKWEKQPYGIPCRPLLLDAAKKLYIGTTWPGQMWHSPDGVKWTKCPALTPNGINKVAVADGE